MESEDPLLLGRLGAGSLLVGLDALADLPRLVLGGFALKVSSGPLRWEPHSDAPLGHGLPTEAAVDVVAIDRDVAVARSGVVARQVVVDGFLPDDSGHSRGQA